MQSPAACRCCLAVRGELVSIHEAGAAQLYLDAVGVPVDPTDHFPQHVCVFCLRVLRRLARFRARSLLVLQLLFQTRLHGNQITIECIQSLTSKHRELQSHYFLTETLILDIPGSEVKGNSNRNTNVPQLPLKIKVDAEENEKMVEILIVKQETAENVGHVAEENDILYKDEEIECLEEIEYLDDFNSLAYDLDEVKRRDTKSEKEITEAKKKFTKLVKSEEYLNDFDSLANDLNDKKDKTKNNTNKKNNRSTTSSATGSAMVNTSKKWRESPHDGRTVCKRRMIEYAKSMGFQLTELSLDDQKKEIEEKKKMPGLVCELCGKRSKNSESLKKHKRCHVLKPKSFMCDICSWVGRTKSLLKVHVLSHRYVFSCKSCDFKTKHHSIMEKHRAFHQGKRFPCNYCGKVFRRNTSLYGHIKASHVTELPWCDLCGEAFTSEQGVINHKKLSHKIPEDYPYTCACSKSFRSEAALDRHIKVSGCDFPSCAQCGESFPSDELLKHHLVQRHIDGAVPATFDCSRCIFRFYNSGALLRHACGAGAACAQCGDTFREPQLLIQHVTTAHHMYRCELCSKQFRCAQFMKQHFLVKHSDVVFSCGRGGGRGGGGARGRGRGRGRGSARGGAPPPIRKWRAVGADVVPEQVLSERPPVSHVCEVCGKGFENSMGLKVHKLQHLAARHRCPHCPKSFRMKSLLQIHLRVHTGERPYQCPQCPKAFKQLAGYTRHYLIHSGVRSHVCAMCDKTFQTSTCVKMHIRTAHLNMPWPDRKGRKRPGNNRKVEVELKAASRETDEKLLTSSKQRN